MAPIADIAPLYVVILDGETGFRRRLAAELSEYGLDTASFGGTEEAFAAIAARTPDVLVLSPFVEVGAGFGLIERLRAGDSPKSTAIIALSHSLDGLPPLVAQAFDAFIVKPCSAQQVVERIDQLFETKTVLVQDSRIRAA